MLNKTLIIVTLTSMVMPTGGGYAIATTTQAIASPSHFRPDNTLQSDLSSLINPQAREGNKEKIVDSGRPPRE